MSRVNAAGVSIVGPGYGQPQPSDQWPPNPQVLFQTRVAILEAVLGALASHGRLEPTYERRILTHGAQAQVMPGVSGQVIVTLMGVYPGLAGQQQFQFPSGDYGAVASSGRRFSRYRVLVLQAWVTIDKESYGSGLPPAAKFLEQTKDVDTDGEICWAALTALGLGGVTTSIPKGPIAQDNTLLASMQAWGPQGGQAGWEYIVEQQL